MKKKSEKEKKDKEESWRLSLRSMHERLKTQVMNESTFVGGGRDETIYHGLKISTTTSVHELGTSELSFCPDTKEYLILRSGLEVLRFSMQGKMLEPNYPLEPSMNFVRMIWCAKAHRMVCFDPEGEQIWIFTEVFEIRSTVKFEFTTLYVFYDEYSNELVIVGPTQSVKVSLEDAEFEAEPTKPVTYSDPEFGPTWQLDRSSLVPKTESNPVGRIVITYMTTLYMVSVDRNPDADLEDESTDFLEKRANAHRYLITAVFFHPPCQWVISGDTQGTVSGWNLKFEQTMYIPGLHQDRVRSFWLHPSICGFLSYSQGPLGGNRLQVWCCNFRQGTESFTNLGEITGIAINPESASVVVLGAKLYYLTMNQLYYFFAPLPAKAKCITVTTNPMFPSRVVVTSTDNTVSMFTPCAKKFNVQILPPTLDAQFSAFSGIKNQLFTVINKTGEILISDNIFCPMKLNKVIVYEGPRITCLAVFDYYDEIRDEFGKAQKPRAFSPLGMKLIAGTELGGIIVFNSTTGKPEAYYSKVHNQAIAELSTTTKCMASLGLDKCVKVWRVLSDLSKPLALYHKVHFVKPVTHIAFMGNVICLVNVKSAKEYQVIMENILSRERLLHHPSKDHKEEIVCMIASERLEICATSSLDNSIRIWDSDNYLRKIIDINICGRPMQFSSAFGDIIFSAGRHLYKIPAECYLPPKYRARIIANDISESEELIIPPENKEYRPYEDVLDINKQLNPYSTTPLLSIDINSENPRVEVLIMQQICALYNYRDDDIIKIKNSLTEPKKLPGNRALMVTEEWQRYVTDLLGNMERLPPETPEYDFESIYNAKRKQEKSYNERAIFQMRFGYKSKELEETTEDHEELINNIKLPLHGFLPNSVLYKEKVEVKPKTSSIHSNEKINIRYKYPPEFYPQDERANTKRASIRLSQLDLNMDADMDSVTQ